MKRLGIVGAGNVSSALLVELARRNLAREVVLSSRDIKRSEAAILDAASAFPEAAANFQPTTRLTGNFEVVVVTAGKTPHEDIELSDLLEQNVAIVKNALRDVECKIIVVTGTPVDRVTEVLSRAITDKQFIGFGGQLDVDRTKYALLKQKIVPEGDVYVIGEHGPRAIPAYAGEESYKKVQSEASSVLSRISAVGKARNLSTGTQLARLLECLDGTEHVLCVSSPHPGYEGLSLTWPHLINRQGLVKLVDIPDLGPEASKLLEQLVSKRNLEAARQ